MKGCQTKKKSSLVFPFFFFFCPNFTPQTKEERCLPSQWLAPTCTAAISHSEKSGNRKKRKKEKKRKKKIGSGCLNPPSHRADVTTLDLADECCGDVCVHVDDLLLLCELWHPVHVRAQLLGLVKHRLRVHFPTVSLLHLHGHHLQRKERKAGGKKAGGKELSNLRKTQRETERDRERQRERVCVVFVQLPSLSDILQDIFGCPQRLRGRSLSSSAARMDRCDPSHTSSLQSS
jgi:hypothetical protein